MNYEIINNNQKRYLLFLHCICGNTKIFKEQFNVLKHYYNFILVDLPAHGLNKDVTPNFTFDSISMDIINILEKENVNKVDIIALSLGSMILDNLILLAPKGLINKVVFTSSLIGFPFNFINPIYNFFVKNIKYFPRSIYMFFITYIMLPLNRDKKYRKKLYNNSILMKKEILYRYFEIMNDYINHSYNKDFSYLKNYCYDYIFVSGNIDLFHFRLKKVLKNSKKLIIIPNASHLCNVETSSIFNSIIINFLI